MKPLRIWMTPVFTLALLGCGGSGDDVSVAANAVANEAAPDRAAADKQVEAPPSGTASPSAVEPTSACLIQDGKAIPENAIHAVGTEPFWAADVAGRCVTYSTPEDQKGTRVWTRFEGAAESGTWAGALGGKPFVLTTRPQQDCSDGMSDKAYPIAVELKAGGETRRGCAEPR